MKWSSIVGALSLAVAVTAIARTSEAQCQGGLVSVQGVCCWPGQSLGPAHNCIGTPQCPAGMQASGPQCVAGAPAATPGPATTPAPITPTPTPTTPTTQTQPSATGWQQTSDVATPTTPTTPAAPMAAPGTVPATGAATWPSSNGPPSPALNPHYGYSPRWGYIWSAVGFFIAAYVPKVIMTATVSSDDTEYNSGCRGAAVGTGLIPVIGGILGLTVGKTCKSRSSYDIGYEADAFHNNAGETFAWIAFGLDLVGIIIATIGLIGHRSVVHDDVALNDSGTIRLSLRPGVVNGSGTTATLSF